MDLPAADKKHMMKWARYRQRHAAKTADATSATLGCAAARYRERHAAKTASASATASAAAVVTPEKDDEGRRTGSLGSGERGRHRRRHRSSPPTRKENDHPNHHRCGSSAVEGKDPSNPNILQDNTPKACNRTHERSGGQGEAESGRGDRAQQGVGGLEAGVDSSAGSSADGFSAFRLYPAAVDERKEETTADRIVAPERCAFVIDDQAEEDVGDDDDDDEDDGHSRVSGDADFKRSVREEQWPEVFDERKKETTADRIAAPDRCAFVIDDQAEEDIAADDDNDDDEDDGHSRISGDADFKRSAREEQWLEFFFPSLERQARRKPQNKNKKERASSGGITGGAELPAGGCSRGVDEKRLTCREQKDPKGRDAPAGRWEVLRRHCGAIHIQTAWRGYLDHRAYLKDLDRIVLLQCIWRERIARQRYLAFKANGDEKFQDCLMTILDNTQEEEKETDTLASLECSYRTVRNVIENHPSFSACIDLSKIEEAPSMEDASVTWGCFGVEGDGEATKVTPQTDEQVQVDSQGFLVEAGRLKEKIGVEGDGEAIKATIQTDEQVQIDFQVLLVEADRLKEKITELWCKKATGEFKHGENLDASVNTANSLLSEGCGLNPALPSLPLGVDGDIVRDALLEEGRQSHDGADDNSDGGSHTGSCGIITRKENLMLYEHNDSTMQVAPTDTSYLSQEGVEMNLSQFCRINHGDNSLSCEDTDSLMPNALAPPLQQQVQGHGSDRLPGADRDMGNHGIAKEGKELLNDASNLSEEGVGVNVSQFCHMEHGDDTLLTSNVLPSGDTRDDVHAREDETPEKIREHQFVLQVVEHGDAEKLYLQLEEIPTPKNPSDIVVKVDCSTITLRDCMIRSGKWYNLPKLPFVPGTDFVGIVHSMGDEAKSKSSLCVGDRVTATVSGGGNAKYITLPCSSAVRVPQETNAAVALCVSSVYVPAYEAMVLARKMGTPFTGANVLVVGGDSASGLAAIELALLEGANVMVTADESHHEFLTKLGAKCFPINPAKWLPTLQGKMDVVLDSLCVDGYESSNLALNPEGTLVCTGMNAVYTKGHSRACGIMDVTDYKVMFWKMKAKYMMNNSVYYEREKCYSAASSQHFRYLCHLASKGSISPLVAGSVPLDMVGLAQQQIELGLTAYGVSICTPCGRHGIRNFCETRRQLI